MRASVTPMPLELGTTKVDLHLTVFDEPPGLRAQIEYDTSLFEAETIDRMLGHFEMLLAGIVAEPERNVLAYPLISDSERQLLDRWTRRSGRCHRRSRGSPSRLNSDPRI